MEAEWTKNIPTTWVCNFFYAFFTVYATFAVLTFFGFIGLFFMNLPKNQLVVAAMQSFLMLGIAATTALFHYLVCSRALLNSIPGRT